MMILSGIVFGIGLSLAAMHWKNKKLRAIAILLMVLGFAWPLGLSIGLW